MPLKKQKQPLSRRDIKLFVDFFYNTSIRIRGIRPNIIRGKDGALVGRALDKFSRSQLEMLSVWFLAKKRRLSPAIGTMLSYGVLDELTYVMKGSTFWKELDEITLRYYLARKESSVFRSLEKPFSLYDVRDLKKYLKK